MNISRELFAFSLITCLLLSMFVAVFAGDKGRSVYGYFFSSLPIFAAVSILFFYLISNTNMEPIDYLIPLAFYMLFCVGVAYLADTRGRSAVGFFLLSLFLSPLIGLIAVLVGGPGTSKASELEHLADLKAKGALSDEEFQRAKAKVIG